jgi:hypothetical protein
MKNPSQKPSKKAAKMLKELDQKELEQVSGASCLTCGLMMSPLPSIVRGLPSPIRGQIVIGS